MSEERKRILDMVASGKITASEAEALLDAVALAQEKSGSSGALVQDQKKGIPKFFRVTVDSKDGDNVDIRIPLSLLKAGIRFSSLMPPAVADKVNDHLSEKGINIDLNNIKKEDIDEILLSLSEMAINVDSGDGDKIRVFCE
ncbi:MAG: hypothetical protein V3S89_00535 [Desulfobacterales bacterium]